MKKPLSSKTIAEICILVLDCFDGIATSDWLAENGYPSIDDMTQHEADMLIKELKAIYEKKKSSETEAH